eukprot:m.57840 g.57840  ORF g.57840 m.57840 type:complete len:141 (-) comp15624_c0_seq2:123-545(-)
MHAVVAGLIGFVVGMMANMAFVLANMALFPMPEGTTFEDTEKFQEYISTLPETAFILVLAAHISQSYVGAAVASRLCTATETIMTVALVIGFLSLIGGLINMQTVQGPTWLYIEIPLYIVVAYIAGSTETQSREKGKKSE